MFAAYLVEDNNSIAETHVNSSSAVRYVPCTMIDCEVDLSHFSFCLLSPSSLFQAHLMLVLRRGCIPVILSRTQPLPFQDHLDWNLAAIRVPSAPIHYILQNLVNLPKEDLLEFRRRGIIFRRRLDNAEALSRSLLAALAEMMHLQLPIAPLAPTNPLFETYESSDSNPMKSDGKEHRRIASPSNQHQMASSRLYFSARWNSGRDLTYSPRNLHDVYGLPAESEYYADSQITRTIGSQNQQAFSRGLGLNREPEQFTVIIMTYNRDDGVRAVIERLKNCPHLNKVIIVWNNIGRVPEGAWPKIHVPVEFIRAERNSVNNRFLPFDRIETDAIFFIDDDMDVIHEELVFAFKVWRQNRDRIVGFGDRYHSWWGDTSKYGRVPTCEYSLLIGAYLVAHKEFFYEYSYNMHPAIREHVDNVMNCDDIALNYHVSHLTRKAPMKVQKIVSMWNSKTSRGLSARSVHYTQRDGCIQKFNAIYGYNPLMSSQMKAMPSLDTCVRGM
ncbi:hypothetical protein PENTCL1PPCAC_29857 [Pristionchus entomophagus]|uniref:Uncharacterized protein n=1 Tax=Pristionchus entomophagus TaxID=358040 RepID=A0AAV5ULZ3_9BILA|nr:hypothetical protein PENTCL1PPCAC_29851 [Pristionchus entomophagus]GMT07683.1 hypothetical protein PENTCL1PPCAC_29857 [Pristionchus entomophagus]